MNEVVKKTIVMVDDNEDMREAFEQLFYKTDINVVCFANVKDALAYLAKPLNRAQVKAIVSDLMMGPTDGLDFLSYIKSKPEFASIDFYLLTGSAVVVFEPFIRSLVLKGVIEKPFNSKDLISLFIKDQADIQQKIAA